jgi:hypothetical protein
MKRIIFLLIVSLLLSSLPMLAAAEQETDLESYDYTQTYDGRFDKSSLYKRNERNPIWRPNHGTLQSISEISCVEALSTLHQTGTWTGNLSEEGECLGTAEAPERTYGNYLNYLHQKTIGSKTSSN